MPASSSFADPPKEGIVDTLQGLEKLGVRVKMITGDNAAGGGQRRAAGRALDGAICSPARSCTQLSDEALRVPRVSTIDIFADIEPNQKERIILALRKAGNVVGYMGDGINDASALHAADVGISVNTAVDVAKEAADFVLLEKDLAVLAQGVREGRLTFSNTLKYVFMATSANFGNMFSMAGASLFLSFLPLLPKQMLLTNLMTDFPEMTIASDNVDPEMVDRPAAVGYPLHPPLHAGLWTAELGLRLRHIRRAAAHLSYGQRGVSHGMVYRVGCLGGARCLGDSHSKAAVSQRPQLEASDGHPSGRGYGDRDPIHAPGESPGIHADPDPYVRSHSGDYRRLPARSRGLEMALLQAREASWRFPGRSSGRNTLIAAHRVATESGTNQ